MTSGSALVTLGLTFAGFAAAPAEAPAAAPAAAPTDNSAAWDAYDRTSPAPPPRVDPAPPATGPAVGPAPGATVAPQPAPAGPPPRRPSGGIGLLVTGPFLVAAGVPLSLWGNSVFRKGCVENVDPDTTVGQVLADSIERPFVCGFSAVGSFLLHGTAFLFYAGGIGMTAAGAAARGKLEAWEDAFETRDPRSTVAHMAAGGGLMAVSIAALVAARVSLWYSMDKCLDAECVRMRQSLATGLVGLTVVGIGTGASLLAYGAAYRRRLRRWAPELAVLPTGGYGWGGMSIGGRF
jgi:hypothetical protein